MCAVGLIMTVCPDSDSGYQDGSVSATPAAWVTFDLVMPPSGKDLKEESWKKTQAV